MWWVNYILAWPTYCQKTVEHQLEHLLQLNKDFTKSESGSVMLKTNSVLISILDPYNKLQRYNKGFENFNSRHFWRGNKILCFVICGIMLCWLLAIRNLKMVNNRTTKSGLVVKIFFLLFVSQSTFESISYW